MGSADTGCYDGMFVILIHNDVISWWCNQSISLQECMMRMWIEEDVEDAYALLIVAKKSGKLKENKLT